jgi:hypothetical protein
MQIISSCSNATPKCIIIHGLEKYAVVIVVISTNQLSSQISNLVQLALLYAPIGRNTKYESLNNVFLCYCYI